MQGDRNKQVYVEARNLVVGIRKVYAAHTAAYPQDDNSILIDDEAVIVADESPLAGGMVLKCNMDGNPIALRTTLGTYSFGVEASGSVGAVLSSRIEELFEFHSWLDDAYALHQVGDVTFPEPSYHQRPSRNRVDINRMSMWKRFTREYRISEGLPRPKLVFLSLSGLLRRIAQGSVDGADILTEGSLFYFNCTREHFNRPVVEIQQQYIPHIFFHEDIERGNEYLDLMLEALRLADAEGRAKFREIDGEHSSEGLNVLLDINGYKPIAVRYESGLPTLRADILRSNQNLRAII